MADELRAVWDTQKQEKACPSLTGELRRKAPTGAFEPRLEGCLMADERKRVENRATLSRNLGI